MSDKAKSAAKRLRKTDKQAILARLAEGPATFPEIRTLLKTNDGRTRTLLMELARADLINGRDYPEQHTQIYELWTDVLQRLRQMPERRHVTRHIPESQIARKVA